jgi:hypothetical protein
MSVVDVFNNLAVSGAGSYYSAPIALGQRPHDVLWIVQTTGTLTGAVGVQITAHSKDDVAWDADNHVYKATATALWVPYTSFSPSATLAIAGPTSDYIDAQELNGKHARLVFTWASNNGNVQAFPTSKQW